MVFSGPVSSVEYHRQIYLSQNLQNQISPDRRPGSARRSDRGNHQKNLVPWRRRWSVGMKLVIPGRLQHNPAHHHDRAVVIQIQPSRTFMTASPFGQGSRMRWRVVAKGNRLGGTAHADNRIAIGRAGQDTVEISGAKWRRSPEGSSPQCRTRSPRVDVRARGCTKETCVVVTSAWLSEPNTPAKAGPGWQRSVGYSRISDRSASSGC